jgi:adenylate kinase family enzyme
MRIAVIGNSGSGKSTLSHQLAALHALPMPHLQYRGPKHKLTTRIDAAELGGLLV